MTVSVCLAKSYDIAAILLPPSSTTTCKSPGLECSDCNSLHYCSPDLQSLFSVKCADQNKLRPFCNPTKNACEAKEPNDCKKESNKFHCPGEGAYPDLEHCRKYYQCNADGSQEHESCGLTRIYSHSTQGCAKGPCRTYNSKLGLCKRKINTLIAYAKDKNLYVLCSADAPKLFQCPKNEIFDEISVVCKFECAQDGFFPAKDADKYYFCYKVGKKYQEMVLQCPNGFKFSASGQGEGACLRKDVTTITPEVTSPEITTPEVATPEVTTIAVTSPEVATSDVTEELTTTVKPTEPPTTESENSATTTDDSD